MIAADALEQCVSDFRAAGNEICANSVQAQADTYRQTAKQFGSSFSSVTSGARISCKSTADLSWGPVMKFLKQQSCYIPL